MDRQLVKGYLDKLPIEKIYPISQGFNFRCPICGDSKKNRTKRRGYILIDDKRATFICHNEHCEETLSSKTIVGLIDYFNSSLAAEFLQATKKSKLKQLKTKKKTVSIFDTLKVKGDHAKLNKEYEEALTSVNKDVITEKPKPLINLFAKENMKVMYLDLEDIPIEITKEFPQCAYDYLKSRNIEYDSDTMYWSPDKNSILFFFLDEYKNPFGYQRRNIDEKRFKIKLHPTAEENGTPKIYGLQNLKKDTLRVYIFESIINSLSVEMGDNEVSISIMGTHLSKDQYDHIVSLSPNAEFIFCLDPDKAGVDKTIQMTKNNTKNKFKKEMPKWNEFKYFVYPKAWNSEIDINDALKIMSKKQIKSIIDNNVFNRMKTFILLNKN